MRVSMSEVAQCMFAAAFLRAFDVTFSCCRCFLSANGDLDTGERRGGATCVTGGVVVATAAALLCIVLPGL